MALLAAASTTTATTTTNSTPFSPHDQMSKTETLWEIENAENR